MDGFTGLDVERAKTDIRIFCRQCNVVSTALKNSLYELGNVLDKKWASPVAVEFTKTYNEKLYDLFSEFSTTQAHIESGAVEAARILAKANGLDFSYDMPTIGGGNTVSWNVQPFSCKEDINRAVGMDTENVKSALVVFKTKANASLTKLNEIPDGIAFYDPAGQMVGGYNRNISEFKGKFNDSIHYLFCRCNYN